jgi:N-ethylmaleimide reductase
MNSARDVLFTPTRLGAVDLSCRIVMAPMTRDRAGPDDTPTPMMAEYYAQRAGAGLIITEGTQPSPAGKGYWRTPGIHTPDQIAGWRRVADAVHAKGGRIIVQIMHCGRVSVRANKHPDAETVAPSAIKCRDLVPGPDGTPVETDTPRALKTGEIPAVIGEFAQAATNARAAGMDGVELHCASGYLPQQFLNATSNQRRDRYGGPIENRVRFIVETLAAMSDAIGADRVGFRISPGNPYNDMADPEPAASFAPLIRAANRLGLAYLHLIDMSAPGFDAMEIVKANWSGAIIANNNLNAEAAAALIAAGKADAASFGRAFIANPDLVARLRAGATLAKPDRATLYTGEARGYTDYPTLEEDVA